MSFTQRVKEEISQQKFMKRREKEIEIYAMLKIKQKVYHDRIEVKVENILIAKRIYLYLKEHTKLKYTIKYSISKYFGKNRIYIITIPNQYELKNMLKLINLLDKIDMLKHKKYLESYIRGMFLVCGYIKNPEKGYALDFFIENSEDAERLCNYIDGIGKKVFCTKKRNKYLVYLRNAEDILDILIMVGAKQAFFHYEDVTVIKDLKNQTIRAMNWEVANETKLLNTANKQITMITYLIENRYYDDLTDALKEVINIRMENPESSLVELADMLGITKSGIRNRFRRLEELYNKIIE